MEQERCNFHWEDMYHKNDPHICYLPPGHEGDHKCGRAPNCHPIMSENKPATQPIQRWEVERRIQKWT